MSGKKNKLINKKWNDVGGGGGGDDDDDETDIGTNILY